ncbi:MAG: RDD family protein [Planctomycetota bacterium]|nr:RDD family protein [Planctomycetota bacterium]
MSQVSFPWTPRGDVIALETPELTRVEYRLAPFGARIVAAALDRLVVLAMLLALVIVGGVIIIVAGAQVLGEAAPLTALAVVIALGFLLNTLYLAWAEARGGGQTIGKRQLGLRTIQLTGQAPGVAAALVRNLARVFDDLPILWVVPTLTASRQRLGDLLAGTCVVVERPPAALTTPVVWPAESWRALAERRFELPPEAADRLVAHDLDLIEYVLRRVQGEPSPARRDALLRPIVRRYLRRLGLAELELPALAAPRRFLGEVGLMLRDRHHPGAA